MAIGFVALLLLFFSGSPSFDLHQVATQFASVKFYEGIVDLCLAAADKLVRESTPIMGLNFKYVFAWNKLKKRRKSISRNAWSNTLFFL